MRINETVDSLPTEGAAPRAALDQLGAQIPLSDPAADSQELEIDQGCQICGGGRPACLAELQGTVHRSRDYRT
jgi:hypothetical protein